MAEWPADKVERRPIEGLVPHARNARTHAPAQVAQIAASMREWGWTNPLLIDGQGNIIAGHGRLLAAHRLGFRDVPVMVAEGWSEAKKRAYVIADNKLALSAGPPPSAVAARSNAATARSGERIGIPPVVGRSLAGHDGGEGGPAVKRLAWSIAIGV